MPSLRRRKETEDRREANFKRRKLQQEQRDNARGRKLTLCRDPRRHPR